ncbi:unnamed protein product [Didymodactylos carnosus]|nr:unnamed protein product [Didymodactylos carnosus]CAF3637171.1 unnamed protein product [Didymodactylos carnosus]
MATQYIPSDAPRIIDIVEGYRRSKLLFTAVKLGVFDELNTGPCTAEELAAKLRANPKLLKSDTAKSDRLKRNILRRLLDACVALELLTYENGKYQNATAASEYLVSTHPNSITGYVNHADRVMYNLWAHLDDAVTEGTKRWIQEYGGHLTDVADNHYGSEEKEKNFVSVSSKIVHCEKQIEKLQSTVDELDNTATELYEYVDELEMRYNELEQYNKRKNLIIPGIFETLNEHTDKIAVDIAKSIGHSLYEKSIYASHRLPTSNKNIPRPIVIKINDITSIIIFPRYARCFILFVINVPLVLGPSDMDIIRFLQSTSLINKAELMGRKNAEQPVPSVYGIQCQGAALYDYVRREVEHQSYMIQHYEQIL